MAPITDSMCVCILKLYIIICTIIYYVNAIYNCIVCCAYMYILFSCPLKYECHKGRAFVLFLAIPPALRKAPYVELNKCVEWMREWMDTFKWNWAARLNWLQLGHGALLLLFGSGLGWARGVLSTFTCPSLSSYEILISLVLRVSLPKCLSNLKRHLLQGSPGVLWYHH